MATKNWRLLKVSVIISLVVSLLLFSRGIYTEIIRKLVSGYHIKNVPKLVLLLMVLPITFQCLNLKLALHYFPKNEMPNPKFMLWHRILSIINSVVVIVILAAVFYRVFESFLHYKQNFMLRGFLDMLILTTIASVVGYLFNIIATVESLKLLKCIKKIQVRREVEMIDDIGK